METVAVIDFETTGLSPALGDRATEIAAVLVQDGQIVDRYESLMNAGVYVSPFIESLTGISNAMVRRAPPAAQVMEAVADFVGDHPLVAHNASFDCRFWDAELQRIDRRRSRAFACSMRLARRLLPRAPSHKLGALAEYADLPATGRHHRALADAELSAHLLLHIEAVIRRRFRIREVSHALLCEIQCAPQRGLDRCVKNLRGGAET